MQQEPWDAFVKEYGPKSGRFLQSWDWGEFQKAAGASIEREVFDDGVGVALWVRRSAGPFGEYWFSPKGPVFSTNHPRPLLLPAGRQGKKEGGMLFDRVEPEIMFDGGRKTIDANPAHTLMTSLDVGVESLRAGMHKKTRYNIGVAERHSVRVHIGEIEFDRVWELFEGTSKRQQFRLHERAYYEAMLSTLSAGECRAFLAAATHEGVVVAANVMIDFDGVRTYLHGASSYEHRSLMATYLLHWELMVDAKAKGMQWYDWWGVSPEDQPKHAWAGISRFKRGFGGEEVEVPGTMDVVYRPLWYRLYQLARRLRRFVG